jgi:hypothetical protein
MVGIAYSDAEGHPLPEFNQALSLYLLSWFILNAIFTVASTRSSWPLFMALLLFNGELILLAAGYMVGNSSLLVAGNAIGFPVALCACKYTSSNTAICTLANDDTEYRLVRMRRIVVRRHDCIYAPDFPHVHRCLMHCARNGQQSDWWLIGRKICSQGTHLDSFMSLIN